MVCPPGTVPVVLLGTGSFGFPPFGVPPAAFFGFGPLGLSPASLGFGLGLRGSLGSVLGGCESFGSRPGGNGLSPGSPKTSPG